MIAGNLGPEVEFRVRKEDWSKYEILGGQGVVWVRAVLLKLYEVNIDRSSLPAGAVPPSGLFAAQTTNLITAFFQEPLKGQRDNRPVTPDELVRPGEDVNAVPLEEPFNEYLIQGATPRLLRTKAVATAIRIVRTRFLATGDPMVQVDSQIVVSPARDARPDELGV